MKTGRDQLIQPVQVHIKPRPDNCSQKFFCIRQKSVVYSISTID